MPTANDVGSLDGHDLRGADRRRAVAACRRRARPRRGAGRAGPPGHRRRAGRARSPTTPPRSWARRARRPRRRPRRPTTTPAGCSFPSPAHADAAYAGSRRRRRVTLHRRALALSRARRRRRSRAPPPRRRRAPTPPRSRRSPASRSSQRGQLRAATPCSPTPSGLGHRRRPARVAVKLGQARTLAGDYRGALAALAPSRPPTSPSCDATRRSPPRARCNAPAISTPPSAPAPAARRRSARSRRAALRPHLHLARRLRPRRRGLRHRRRSLGRRSARPGLLYLGRLDEADAAFADVERAAAPESAALARARSARHGRPRPRRPRRRRRALPVAP